MKHWPALLIATVGGAVAALGVVIGVGGALLGVLWLYVFGDDPWPPSAEAILNLAIPISGLLLWVLFGWMFYLTLRGRR